MKHFYKQIEETCAQIEAQWLKCNCASEDFYKVVLENTADLDLSPLKDISFQMDLLQDSAAVRHNQQRSTFSDLYFQLYHNGRFMIEILNWAGSHVNVHDHDFSGVQFQLKGNSLNVVYDFETTSQAGALEFGRLSVRKAEIWKEGGRSVVRHGDLDPHGVFHLNLPTTSLLIRTTPTPRMGSQHNYFPSLRANYYVNNDIQRKKLTGLGLLAKQSQREYRVLLEKLLNSQSLSENLFMLVKLGEIAFQEETADLLQTYAERGESETRVVRDAIFNTGIDFFKTAATQRSGVQEDERLAASIVAATHNPHALDHVVTQLAAADDKYNFKTSFAAFLSKLSSEEQKEARHYLEVFELGEVIYA